ncbi:zinc-binding alcohol dehydrogenase family protein [Bacillus sp. CGMCC 1.16607]|uniref:quinone oxidoreductase family protein n=1 Tax=Bacillus sp. CGMCC 1.16607 TaxID=3351842 RepID=UPI00362725F2
MLAVTVNPQVKRSLQLEEVAVPKLEVGEVLVKIKTAALNHRDLYVNNEWRALNSIDKRIIAGGDGAGTIVEIGEGVNGWSIGDEVILNPYDMVNEKFLGGPVDGTLAEYVRISGQAILRKPEYLSFEEAAGVPLALSTAWGNVVTQGKIMEGETVLLQGIGGGVALFILQLALEKGAKVIVTSGSDDKIKRAIEMGAMVGFNYKTENISEKVLEFTAGRGVDVVIDSSGKDSIESSIKSLTPNGRLLVFGSTTGGVDWEKLKNEKYFVETGMVQQHDLEEALQFYAERELRPVLSQKVYSLEEYKDAYQELEEAKQFGKIILSVY